VNVVDLRSLLAAAFETAISYGLLLGIGCCVDHPYGASVVR
jgi:hypothetical protein